MANFRIFTESKADVKFISDFILARYKISLTDAGFYKLNSWSGYKEGGNVIADIRQSIDNGEQVILILDADNNFNDRQTEVLNDFIRYEIPVQLFLFPNNASSGNLENLLTEIAVERKLIECFRSYENCVRDYNLPLDKSRIYSYLDTLLPATDKIYKKNDLRVEENRNYRNGAHWNLHHEYLQPLHEFLLPLFG